MGVGHVPELCCAVLDPLLFPCTAACRGAQCADPVWSDISRFSTRIDRIFPEKALNPFFGAQDMPWQYLPLDTGSLSRGAVAAGQQLQSSLRQSKFNLTRNFLWKFKFNLKFTCNKLIRIIRVASFLQLLSTGRRYCILFGAAAIRR